MKKIVYIAAFTLLCTACFHVNTNWSGGKNAIKGEGPVISKTFEDLKDFDKIEINGHADVNFTQSSVYEVTVRTQENVLDYLDYKVEGTTLVIETKDHRSVRAEKYDLVIQAPALKRIEVNGAADFDIKSGLVSEDDLRIEVNGAGDLTFNDIRCKDLTVEVNGAADAELTRIEVGKLKVEVNGAGDAEVSGHAAEASFAVNGAGGIDARGLKVDGEVRKHTSGLAKIQL
jgi:hypothetical protein